MLNVQFKGNLEIKQLDYSSMCNYLEPRLKPIVEKMPEGDKIEVKIEPTDFVIRTKYIPGDKAPIGAEKITISQKDPNDTIQFTREISEQTQNPTFSLEDFLNSTSLFIHDKFNRLFVGKKGEVDYDNKQNSYIFRKTGIKITNNDN